MIRARADRWFERFRKTGDPRLLAKVFDRTAPELGKVAAHLSRDRHAAEDAVQSTFLAAIEARHEWDAARPLLPWLLGLLVHRVRQLRRQQRSPEATRVALPAGERDPKDLADAREVDGALRDALQRIPEPYRDTLERHLVHGLAAHEIAEATGVPAGTVRMRLHRGLDQLRQKLPPSLAMGGVLATLPPEVLATMRREVLATVPGGSEVGAASTGHFAVGWLGVIMMNKILMTVLVASFALVTFRWFLPADPDPTMQPVAVAASGTTAATTTASGDAPLAAATIEAERRAVDVPPPSTALGTLRIAVFRGGTNEPIAGLRLDVSAGHPADATKPGADPKPTRRHGTTDAAGEVTFQLPPGVAFASYTFDPTVDPWRVPIVDGQTAELAVTLPIRIDTMVSVVDDTGRPLAGARIFAATSADMSLADHEVGRTDPEGRFRACFIERTVPLRAEHDGFACSPVARLDGQTSTLRLELARNPATLSGTVYDRNGKPMAEALVMLVSRRPGHREPRPIPIRADAAGRFVSRHVQPGKFILVALPSVMDMTHGLARIDGEVAPGQARDLDLRFGSGATLLVKATDAFGKPVAGKSVAADLQPDDDLPALLIVYAQLTRTTDENGIAEFAGICAGTWLVSIDGTAPDRAIRVQLQANATEQVTVSAVAKTWLEVRVVDDQEQPRVGWEARLGPAAGGVATTLVTDAEGLVRFDDLPDQLYELMLHAPKSALPSLRRNVANAVRSTIRVPDSLLPTAIVHGTLRLPAGHRPDAFRVEIEPQGRAPRTAVALADDASFRSDGLPPGTYRVFAVRTRDNAILVMPIPIELAAGATHDVGAITIPSTMPLSVEVTTTATSGARGVFVAAALPAAPRRFGRPPQSTTDRGVTIPEMLQGDYELLVWGEDIAPTFARVSVAPENAPTTVAARAATPVTLVLQGAALAGNHVELRFFRDGKEQFVLHTEQVGLTFGFDSGSWRVEVATSGFRGSAEFVVTAAAEPRTVSVALAK